MNFQIYPSSSSLSVLHLPPPLTTNSLLHSTNADDKNPTPPLPIRPVHAAKIFKSQKAPKTKIANPFNGAFFYHFPLFYLFFLLSFNHELFFFFNFFSFSLQLITPPPPRYSSHAKAWW